MNSYFPDINVWLALTLKGHVHFRPAWAWYQALPLNANLVFSRISQLGLLRLLTTRAVALENTMTQAEAWAAYDRWLLEGGAIFAAEPFGLEPELRARANLIQAAPKNWTDSYLAAFATAHSLQLVTFDKALSRRCRRSVLLA